MLDFIKHNNMKKLFLFAAILFGLSAGAQTYDSSLSMPYMSMEPVTWIRDKPQVNRLYVVTLRDNIMVSATINWFVAADSMVIANGTMQISGEDYTQWNPLDLSALFYYVAENKAGRLNLDILD